MGSLSVGHDWAISLSLFTFMDWRRKRQSTPVFLPGESQGRGSLVGCRLWVAQSWTRLKWLSKGLQIFLPILTPEACGFCIIWKKNLGSKWGSHASAKQRRGLSQVSIPSLLSPWELGRNSDKTAGKDLWVPLGCRPSEDSKLSSWNQSWLLRIH